MVQEIARIVGVEAPYIDTVLGLTRQMGRIAAVYPVIPEPEPAEEDLAVG